MSSARTQLTCSCSLSMATRYLPFPPHNWYICAPRFRRAVVTCVKRHASFSCPRGRRLHLPPAEAPHYTPGRHLTTAFREEGDSSGSSSSSHFRTTLRGGTLMSPTGLSLRKLSYSECARVHSWESFSPGESRRGVRGHGGKGGHQIVVHGEI